MGSAYPPTKRDYGDKTRIDMNQSYQVAYWKERFGVTEQELSEAVRAAGALASKVETYLNLRMLANSRAALTLGRRLGQPCHE